MPDGLSAGDAVKRTADDIVAGRFRLFSHLDVELGPAPDWHRNVVTEERLPSDVHWSLIGDFAGGDIKVVWEPSRFAFAYDLARAYLVTGDERYPERFWALVEGWQAANPPNTGANWKSGQEVALRVMAWTFALGAFLHSPATTSERFRRLAVMIAFSGVRIEATLDYAISQRNNHALSDAVGLWTIGLLFPELPRARRWKERGRRILEEETVSQVYDDGSYVQHSTNYHRLMLHVLLWAIRIGEGNGERLPECVYRRFAAAHRFLMAMTDPESGEAPNTGANDGALVLPLETAGFGDIRPVLAAGHYLIHGERLLPGGPWDETLFWLFGEQSTRVPAGAGLAAVQASRAAFPIGGYEVLRGAESWCVVRCAAFRDRPSHADQLHVDLWWRGTNVAVDPGTYSYNAPEPWDNALGAGAFHNTVTVDGRDHMDKVGRFLWLPWAMGRTTHRYEEGDLSYWQGEHDGYARCSQSVLHRRAVIRLPDDGWVVVDDVSGGGNDARLHWLLTDAPFSAQAMGLIPEGGVATLTLDLPGGPFRIAVGSFDGPAAAGVVRADAETPRGWRSRRYLEREAALAFTVDAPVVGGSRRFWTVLGPNRLQVEPSSTGLRIRWNSRTADIRLGRSPRDSLVTRVDVDGLAVGGLLTELANVAVQPASARE